MRISKNGYFIFLLLLCYITLCTYFIGIKDANVWKDYLVYKNYYYDAQNNSVLSIISNIQDPLFVLFMKPFTYDFNGFGHFLIVCAFVTLFFKFFAISRADTNVVVFIILYSSYLLCLHEYIQIRIALALGILLYSVYWIKRPLVQYAMMIIALLFHFSVIVPVLVYVVVNRGVKGFKFIYLFSPLLIFFPLLFKSGFFDINRINSYLALQGQGVGVDINIFSTLPFIQLCTLIFIFLSKKYKYSVYTYEYIISFLGVFIFYSFLSIPVLALRYFEVCNVFFLIILAKNYNKSYFFITVIIIYLVIGIKNYSQLIGLNIPFLG